MKKPTKKQWSKLYEIADVLKQMAPWKHFYDTDIITIFLPDYEDPVFCSIMGMNDESYTIAAYIGEENFEGFQKIVTAPPIPFSIINSYQNCLVCNYGDREELTPEDRAVLKDLEIKYRGSGNWTFFRTYDTGFYPWFIDSEQCKIFTSVLENLYMALLAMSQSIVVDFQKGETLIRKYSKEHDEWINFAAEMPDFSISSKVLTLNNEILLKKLNNTQKNYISLELDLYYPMMPIQETKTQRPHFPAILVIANKEAELLEYHQPLEKNENIAEFILDIITEYIFDCGKPKAIYIRDNNIEWILDDFCKKTKIELIKSVQLHVIDEFLYEMEKDAN